MNIIEITIEGKVRLAWDELDHPSDSQFYLSKNDRIYADVLLSLVAQLFIKNVNNKIIIISGKNIADQSSKFNISSYLIVNGCTEGCFKWYHTSFLL